MRRVRQGCASGLVRLLATSGHPETTSRRNAAKGRESQCQQPGPARRSDRW
jgi:hypothetical protein